MALSRARASAKFPTLIQLSLIQYRTPYLCITLNVALTQDTSHLNMPDSFHQDPWKISKNVNKKKEKKKASNLAMLKTVRQSSQFIWIQTKS